MVSKFVLLSNLLLASAALAGSSSSPVGAPLARGRETQRATYTPTTRYTNNFAGASWVQAKGTFTTVTASIDVPSLSGSDGVVMAWIGIDSDTVACTSGAYFRAGLKFTISGGQVSSSAWWQWFPEYYYEFTNFAMNASDTITVHIITSSPNVGEVFIQNQENGQAVSADFTAFWDDSLCQATAGWMVSVDTQHATTPLADFGSMVISSASASDSSGVLYSPGGSGYNFIIKDMETLQDLTSIITFGTTIIVGRLET